MIKLQEVKEEEQELLWNINQKYQYEMTTYYPDKMDEQGNQRYSYNFIFYYYNKKQIGEL